MGPLSRYFICLAHSRFSPTKRGWPGTLVLATAIIFSLTFVPAEIASARSAPVHVTLIDLNGKFPVGVPDPTQPSGDAPPSSDAMVGYHLSYVANFTSAKIPKGWDLFSGVPGGDPGGRFSPSHVEVSDGMLQINTFQDPAFQNTWVTGGLCQCGRAMEYGAYFVRSRQTGAGPTDVQLLWPASNTWPPEIDFNETGGSATSTSSSVHFGKTNHVVQRHVDINMTLWHTWGVIWTPSFIEYTVDGRIWGIVQDASEVPHTKMTLDFEQRQECEENRQCPTAPESMQIDWVAEYAK